MKLTLLRLGVLLALGPAAMAVDWPQYRGPRSDGSTPETIRTDWNQNPPAILWKKTLGPGWSSISVAAGRAVTQVKRTIGGTAREVVVALDAATGRELWARDLGAAAYNQSLSGAAPDALDGPRSTPSIAGDRVYVITSSLKVACLDAPAGNVLWLRDLVAEAGAEIIPWSNGASPLVVGDRLFLNASIPGKRLTALSTVDGATLWSGQSDANTHSTPIFATLGDAPQVVFLTMRGLVAVVPETGAVLWRYGFAPSSTSTAASPLIGGDFVYASCAYGKGAWTARLRQNGNAFTLAEARFQQETQYQNHWATPVIHDDALYGIVEAGGSGRTLVCYDLASRANRWRTTSVGSGAPGYASLIKAGDKIIVLTERGELVLVQPGSAYLELGRFKALNSYCWNQPTVSGGRLFARSSAEIIALDVGPAVRPLPELRLTAQLDPARNRLHLVVQADAALDGAIAARLALQAAGSVDAEWTALPAALEPNAGVLEVYLPLDGNIRFLRVREKAPGR